MNWKKKKKSSYMMNKSEHINNGQDSVSQELHVLSHTS